MLSTCVQGLCSSEEEHSQNKNSRDSHCQLPQKVKHGALQVAFSPQVLRF